MLPRGDKLGGRETGRVSVQGVGVVMGENVLVIFCRHVAGKAFFVQRLIAGLAVGKVGVSQPVHAPATVRQGLSRGQFRVLVCRVPF